MNHRVPGLHAAVVALMALRPPAAAEDCNSNGVVERDEIAAGLARDCDGNAWITLWE